MAAPSLVVIDHEEARVFRSLVPGTAPVKILATPLPADSAIPLPVGPRNPPGQDYLEAIAQAIGDPDSIQIYGSGSNSGADVNALVAWLEAHHSDLAARVVATQVVPDRFWSNSRYLTQGRNQLAKQAHALFAS
jgi:hypothetical protein